MAIDTSLTFRHLLIRLADQTGLAVYPADGAGPLALPGAGTVHRNKLEDAVNDGIRQMVRDWPKWTCLRPRITMALTADGTGADNIDSDPNRYRIPGAIEAAPMGEWIAYTTDGSWRGMVSVRPTGHLVALIRTPSIAGGVPRAVSIGPIQPADRVRGERAGLEMLVWPTPDRTYVIEGQARVVPAPLINLDDRPLFSAAHDMTILSAALKVWHENNADLKIRDHYKIRYMGDLAASKALDALQETQQLGTLQCPTEGSAFLAGSDSYAQVTAYDSSTAGVLPLV